MAELNKPFTVIESPFSAPTIEGLVRNVQYTMLAVRDSLNRGEAPYASHLFYTQMLDDNNAVERQLGMDAGLTICQHADQTAIYIDLGMSRGMEYGIEAAKKTGRAVVERRLFPKAASTNEVDTLMQQEYEKQGYRQKNEDYAPSDWQYKSQFVSTC
jgi:hypothetical protein